jgi:hypothetical protein
MDSSKTKVPLSVRKEARRLLKHFPMECELNELIRCHTEWMHEVNMKRVVRVGDHIEYCPRSGGWIFWMETFDKHSKPYFCRRDAETAFAEYLKELNEEAKALTNEVNNESIGKSTNEQAD